MTFKKLREQYLPNMNATVQEFEDDASGAKHIHLKSDSSENVFVVSLPTIPDTDDGRAHILEHLALCGSESYPTRDPFFSMIRRSMQTFMNAMTYPDRTVYPFASQDKKDYFNLLGVYLDAVFFPKLDYLDFRQEGWRYELETDADGNEKLVHQGVVFNEMKGALSSGMSVLYHGVESALKQGTTYEALSGGDPESIPDLSYEELKAFHQTHYHPSRAVFMSYGNIPPEEIQAQIQEKVTSRITNVLPRVKPELVSGGHRVTERDILLPSQAAREDENTFQVAFLLSEVTDLDRADDFVILEQALLANSSSPITMAIENAGFGRPSSLTGMDSNGRQQTLHIGMEGLLESELPEARTVIFNALEEVAKNGIDFDRLQQILRDFELHTREVQGAGQPHGLQILLGVLPVEMNGGDVIDSLNVGPHLDSARERFKNPDHIKNLTRHLLDSASRVEAKARPNKDYFIEKEAKEKEGLAQKQQSLSKVELAQIRTEAAQLKERQRQTPDVSCLPTILPSDIARELPSTPSVDFKASTQGPSIARIEIPSNGVTYARLQMDTSHIAREDWPWVDLYADLLSELGHGDLTYDEAKVWRHAQSSTYGTLSGRTNAPDFKDAVTLKVILETRGLPHELESMSTMLSESFLKARLDESERLGFLIESNYQDMVQSLAESGQGFADLRANAPFSAGQTLDYQLDGPAHVIFFKSVYEQSQTPEGMLEIQKKLQSIHELVKASPSTAVISGAKADIDVVAQSLSSQLSSMTPNLALKGSGVSITVDHIEAAQEVLHASTPVNYCYKSFAAPKANHPDSGVMSVLSKMLSHGYLHRALREEGGAYGGSAAYSESGSLTLSSYRDPRMSGTYHDFDKAVDWLLTHEHTQESLDEAIVSVIARMDKPSSPRGEAMMAWGRAQNGITPELRLARRHAVLNCTLDDVIRCAKTYLQDTPSSNCAFVGDAGSAEAQAQGFTVVELDGTKPKAGFKM